MWQGMKLLPEARGRDLFFVHCMACHGFQSRMAAVTRNEDGWRDRMNYMRDAMGFFVMDPRFGFNDQKAEDVIFYMNHVFGEDFGAAEVAGRAAELQGHAAAVSATRR